VQRALDLYGASDGRVVGRIDGGETVRFSFRFDIGRPIDPHETVLLSRGVAGDTTRILLDVAAKPRDLSTSSLDVVPPSVVSTLDLILDDASEGERDIAMGAPIEQRPGPAIGLSKEREGGPM